MIIKYCLAITSKSSAAYKDLRYDSKKGTGVLVLPSQRTLRDYKNYIRPEIEFNHYVVKQLTEKTKSFMTIERYINLVLDEMKVLEDLVGDKTTGELIGFVDLGDIDLDYATVQNAQQITTHILVFMVKSIANPLSYSFANFATNTLTSYQLYPVFWKAVSILEMSCNLKVTATVADGASTNRKIFRMRKVILSFK